jgi:hypothetical protein
MVNVDAGGDIVDYAMPMMQIEKLMRYIHDHCLDKQYPEAQALCADIIAEARVLYASLALMQEKNR